MKPSSMSSGRHIAGMPLTVAVASDHAGVNLKTQLTLWIEKAGWRVLEPACLGCVDYPDYALQVTSTVANGSAAFGVLICGTGIGMSIAANKVRNIRAALCRTEFEARMARAHNDANVLCLGQRITGEALASEILNSFLMTSFEGGRHISRLEKIHQIETMHQATGGQ